jgi:hypothetical protein
MDRYDEEMRLMPFRGEYKRVEGVKETIKEKVIFLKET